MGRRQRPHGQDELDPAGLPPLRPLIEASNFPGNQSTRTPADFALVSFKNTIAFLGFLAGLHHSTLQHFC